MKLDYTAVKEDCGKELKTILKSKLRLSGTIIKKIKKYNGFLVNGISVFVIHKLREGDKIEVFLDFEDDDPIEAEDMDIEILYEDKYLIILNKQAGIVVHPTRAHPYSTLANALKYYYITTNSNARIHPVTRLDKETSGIIIFAKNPYIHNLMMQRMKENRILKEYTGIISGHMENHSGTICLPIKRSEEEKMIRVIHSEGKESTTYFEVIETYDHASYLKFVLVTGRTHQIRVHCKALGHPLVGDKLYGGNELEKNYKIENLISRQALHSFRTIFTHPVTEKEIIINAPLPEDMLNALNLLRNV